MFNIKASDFTTYDEYDKANRKLQKAQAIAKEMFCIWNNAMGVLADHTCEYDDCLGLIEDAVKVGIEEILEIPHVLEAYNVAEYYLDNYPGNVDFINKSIWHIDANKATL